MDVDHDEQAPARGGSGHLPVELEQARAGRTTTRRPYSGDRTVHAAVCRAERRHRRNPACIDAQTTWNADWIGAHTWNAAASYITGSNTMKFGYQGAYHGTIARPPRQ